jgi:DUF4097 and DUF4098 domain-containing protein YvlB
LRPPGSITGPIIVILIGVVFLIHAFAPAFQLADLVAWYWPYVLIAWGAIAFLEVTLRALRGATIPLNGISGGGWVMVILICLAGLTVFQFRRGGWWQQTNWVRGFSEAFAEEHEYSVGPLNRSLGAAPHVVLESYRGDAKVVGADGNSITVTGHKTIRAIDTNTADGANASTPVEIQVQGNRVIVRCNQDRADARSRVSTDLDITVPRSASLQATNNHGDFDVSALAGDVDLTGAASTIKLQDVGGSARITVNHSDGVNISDVKGDVSVKGYGTDVSLLKVAGEVLLSGDFRGSISLKELARPVRFQSARTRFEAQQITGNVDIDRGSFNGEGLVGPVKLASHATDITLAAFSNAVTVNLDRGDIELRPGRLPLAHMDIHDNAGNIELSIPTSAQFAISATTRRGDIENEFSGDLTQKPQHYGAALNGSIGNGPEVNVSTGRGNITLKKASLEQNTVATLNPTLAKEP